MTAPHQKDSAPVENRLILVADQLEQAVARLAHLVDELKGEIRADTEYPGSQSSEQEQP